MSTSGFMTVKEAAFALIDYYETGGARNGSFSNSLIATMSKADYSNRARLSNAFPEFSLPLQFLQNEGLEGLKAAYDSKTFDK